MNCIFSLFIVSDLRSPFSLKKTGVQRKKYGLLSNYDDTMEMAHLESDEDDTTVYEAKSLRRYSNLDINNARSLLSFRLGCWKSIPQIVSCLICFLTALLCCFFQQMNDWGCLILPEI